MARPRSTVPSYRLHRQSGQAVTTLVDAGGRRHDVLLGKHDSPESRIEYARTIARWEASGRRLPSAPSAPKADVSVNELALDFLKHAEHHYRHPDGTATGETREYRMAVRPLCHLFGALPAAEFGPLALKSIRELMIHGYDHPKHGEQGGVARGVVNQRMGRIRRVFKFGVENEMIPPSVLQGLQAVRGLQRGRSAARETKPIRPVHPDIVEQTLPHLSRPVAAMVRLQLLTGARPGEVAIMRGCDLDTTGPVWLYRPGSTEGPEGQHKTAHHGYERVIAIGPKAQAIIKNFLKLDTRAYLFSPVDAEAERRAEQRRNRKTKVQPSQQDRRKPKPRKSPGDRYTTGTYKRAIADACRDAFPPPAPLCRQEGETKKAWLARLTSDQQEKLRQWNQEHRWNPHRLRHTAATTIRRECGLDTARVVLGHRTPAITELYAELDVGRAVEAMARLG
jgi:integrase